MKKKKHNDSKERLRNSIENSGAGYFFIDSNGYFQDVNQAWLKMHKYDRPEEVIGKHYSLTQTEADLEKAKKNVNSLLTGNPITSGEFSRRCKDGSVGYHTFSANPVYSGGKLVGLEGFLIDITERKQVEEELKFTRLILNNADETMTCIADDGRFIDVNDAFCRSAGYSRKELLSMTVHDIDPNYPAEKWLEFWEKLKQAGSLIFESCHRTKDGKLIPVEIIVKFFEHNGKEYHCGFARDITERKRAEIQIQYQANLLANVSDAILATDRQFNIQYWNTAAEKQYGWTSAEVLGSHFMNFIQPQYLSDSRRTVMQKIVQEGFWNGELVHNRRDGTRFPVQVTISEVRNAEGQIIGHVTINRDITERKHAEELLRESEKKYRTLFDDDLAGNFITLVSGELLLCNQAFARLFGFGSVDEALQVNVNSLYKSSKDREQFLNQIRKKKKLESHEQELIRPDGKIINVLLNVTGEFDAKNKLIKLCGYLFDITERKQAEEILRQKMKELERFNDLTVGRELTMIELKKEVNELLKKAGGKEKYKIVKTYENTGN